MVVGWIYYDQLFAWLSAPFSGAVEQARAEGREVTLALTGVADPFVAADADRRDGRRRPGLAGLAVPAVALRHPRPAPQRASLGLRLRRRRHAAVPRRRGARLRRPVPSGSRCCWASRPTTSRTSCRSTGTCRSSCARCWCSASASSCRLMLVLLNFAGSPARATPARLVALDHPRRDAVRRRRDPDGRPVNLMLLAGPILVLVAVAVVHRAAQRPASGPTARRRPGLHRLRRPRRRRGVPDRPRAAARSTSSRARSTSPRGRRWPGTSGSSPTRRRAADAVPVMRSVVARALQQAGVPCRLVQPSPRPATPPRPPPAPCGPTRRAVDRLRR